MEATSNEVTYRNATAQDLRAIARLYLLAFPDSVRELETPDLSSLALADLMFACLKADREAILVAEADPDGETRIIGYVVGVANTNRVWRMALLRGLALVWIWRWITGRYRLPLRRALGVFQDKLQLWSVWRSSACRSSARILSTAVSPEWQRRGIGGALLERALSRLRALGCPTVALEVRSENQAAKALYLKHGFEKVAGFRSTRGAWEVMVLRLAGEGVRAGRRQRLLAVLLVVAGITVLFSGYAWLKNYLAWRSALRAAGFVDEMSSPGRGDRVLVVAPHPDDEMLGCGGLLQQAVAAGAEVHVVLMTNGDGSELAIIFGEKELPLTPGAYLALGRRRQQESLRALKMIGVPSEHVHFLGYPNDGLTTLWRPEHWLESHPYTSAHTRVSSSPYQNSYTRGARYCGAQVLSDLTSLLDQVRPTHIYVTHPQDIHPDHWATNAFLRYALAGIAARGGQWAQEVEVYGYLIHWPMFPVPRKRSPSLDLFPPTDMRGEGSEWLRLPLSSDQTKRKLKGIMVYRTQMPRFDGLLKSFARSDEIFAALPPVGVTWDTPHRWSDEDSHRPHTSGAEIRGAAVTLRKDGTVRAAVETGPKVIGKHSYVAFDLRTWDDRGAPLITTAYLSGRGSVQVEEVSGETLRRQKAASANSVPGLFEIAGIRLAGDVKDRGVFVSCWGSVGDRFVDPAVVSWVRVGEE